MAKSNQKFQLPRRCALDSSRVVSSVSFPIFSTVFCEPLNVKLQGYLIFEFLATLKTVQQSTKRSSDGTYRRKQVSMQYRYSDILPKILITNFTSTSQSRISTFGLRIFQVSSAFAPFPGYFHFRFLFIYFFGIFGHYFSDNTKYRYLNNVSILHATKRYRYSIDSTDTISHH